MRKLATIFVSLLMLSLVIGTIGCAEEQVPTLIPTSTPAPTPTPTPTPTPAPTAALRFYNAGEQAGDGIYTPAVIDAITTTLEGKVLLQGNPTPWPTTSDWAWPSDYPPLQSGKVLVIFMSGMYVDSYLYCAPGQQWQQDNPKVNAVFGGVDVYYYCSGYVIAKFENVPITQGKATVLPEIALIPVADSAENPEWVFYTEEGSQAYH